MAAVVTDPSDHRQAWEGLLGQFHPQQPVLVAGASVVAGGVGRDHPQLAHLCLEGGDARVGLDAARHPDHLLHPSALLGRSEVGAHAGADGLGLADVEDLAPHPTRPVRLVGVEAVDAGAGGQLLRPSTLGASLGGDPVGELGEVFQSVDAQVAHPLHQGVQHVDGGAGVGQGPVVGHRGGAEVRREGGQLAVGHLVT